MGAGSTKRIKIYEYDRIFDRAVKRLWSAPNICEEDKANVMKLVEHLLAKGVSKPRAVKYIYHLTVIARMVGKPFKQLRERRCGEAGKPDVERLVSQMWRGW